MRVRVTLMTENDVPVEKVGETKERRHDTVLAAWKYVIGILQSLYSDESDKIEVEAVEVVDDADNT